MRGLQGINGRYVNEFSGTRIKVKTRFFLQLMRILCFCCREFIAYSFLLLFWWSVGSATAGCSKFVSRQRSSAASSIARDTRAGIPSISFRWGWAAGSSSALRPALSFSRALKGPSPSNHNTHCINYACNH